MAKGLTGADDQWTGNSDNTYRLLAQATATGTNDVPHSVQTRAGGVLVTFQYVGSATDTPPSQVSLSYTTKLTGRWNYVLAGRPSPNGSGTASFNGELQFLDGTKVSNANSSGTVSQATVTKGGNYEPLVTTFGGQIVATPLTKWTHTDNGPVRTYTLSAIITTATGAATADCTAFGLAGTILFRASWEYRVDVSSIKIAS